MDWEVHALAAPTMKKLGRVGILFLDGAIAEGCSLFRGSVAGLEELDCAAVGGVDAAVGELPVPGIGDGAGGGGLDVAVVDAEVDQRGIGVGGDVEGFFRAGGFDVPDMDIAKVRETAFGRGDGGGKGD